MMVTNEVARAQIKEQYQAIVQAAEKLSSSAISNEWAKEREKNSTCPKCNSKSINDRIRRIKGEGSVSGTFSSSLLFGSGSLSGHSEVDTEPVNKCNDCGHEWKKYKVSYKSAKSYITDWTFKYYRYAGVRDKKSDYVYTDALDCEFNSKEEAEAKYQEDLNSRIERCKDTPIAKAFPEVIIALSEKYDGVNDPRAKAIRSITSHEWEAVLGNNTIDYPDSPFLIKAKVIGPIRRFWQKNGGGILIIGGCVLAAYLLTSLMIGDLLWI